MAAINDLINQIENPQLRVRIQQEVDRMNKIVGVSGGGFGIRCRVWRGDISFI